ncbi:organic cation transporter protein-like [Amphiura filiformis]|uniref:organic cation transporter protein-like n=1 Tax=Amphiura filiformis TaxID=82378 RepID=UPI003B216D98
MLFDEVLSLLGDFDRYQRRTYFLVCLLVVPAAWHVLAQVFTAAEVDHWCIVPQLDEDDCSRWNLTQRECQQAKKDASIPKVSISSSGKITYASCNRYDMTGIDFYPGIETANITNSTTGCHDGWVYDTSQYKSTIVTEFNLVCGKQNTDDYVQSVFFAGFLVGSFFFGSLADWIGRQKTLFICLLLQSITGLIVAFSPAFWFFTMFRFFLGGATIGVYFISFVLATEFVRPSKRIIIGALIATAFAVGYMVLAIFAVMIRQWWVLQLVISLPIILLLPLVFILPESARWLMARGKYRQAEKIIRKVAKVNGTKLPENLFLEEMTAFEELESANHEAAHRRTSFLDLFRTPNMRIKTINVMFNWFVNSMVYHGLSLSTSTLGTNDYAAFFISGAVEIPSYILMIFVAERWGRRPVLTTSMVIGGFACFISIFLPSGAARLTFAMIGKFFVALSFALIYVFSVELFPTPVRSVGMGVSNVACFVGAMLTPILLTLSSVWEPLPYFVFGLLEIVAGIAALLLPETLGKNLPDTLDEGEKFGSNRLRKFFGRLPAVPIPTRGPQSRPSSLWMNSPTYEKVDDNDNNTHNTDTPGKGTSQPDSLWIPKPPRGDMFAEKVDSEDDDKPVIDDTYDDDDDMSSADETTTMELSTFREENESNLKIPDEEKTDQILEEEEMKMDDAEEGVVEEEERTKEEREEERKEEEREEERTEEEREGERKEEDFKAVGQMDGDDNQNDGGSDGDDNPPSESKEHSDDDITGKTDDITEKLDELSAGE